MPHPSRARIAATTAAIVTASVVAAVAGAAAPSAAASKKTVRTTTTKKKTTTKKGAASATAGSSTTTTLAPAASIDPAKVLAAAAPVETDLGSEYRYVRDPTGAANDAVYRGAMDRTPACAGFPDALPFFSAKAKAIGGWAYAKGTRGTSASIVITADDATAHAVLEAVRGFPSFAACNAGMNDTLNRDNLVAQPTLAGRTITVVSSNIRLGAPLAGFGDDQITLQFESVTTINGVAQPAVLTTRHIGRFGPAILTWSDDPTGADRVAPVLAAKLMAALKG